VRDTRKAFLEIEDLEGEMEFEIEGKIQHPQPGEELLIPLQTLHSAQNTGTSLARWLYGCKKGT
jgi:quercetin dioxygenase-like cupin family protein